MGLLLALPYAIVPTISKPGRRLTGSQKGLVDRNLHNTLAVHLTSRWSLPQFWRCLVNGSFFFNFTFEICVLTQASLDYAQNYRY